MSSTSTAPRTSATATPPRPAPPVPHASDETLPRGILRSSAPGPTVRLERKRDWHAQVAPCFRLPAPKPQGQSGPAELEPIPDFSNPWSHRATLDICGHAYQDAELHGVMGELWWQLRTLNLGDNRFTFAGMDVLAHNFPLGLTTLILFGNPLHSRGIRRLVQAPWSWLRRLDLRDCQLGDAGLSTLVRHVPSQLREVRLGHNGLGPASATALAQAPLRALELLDVGHNPLGGVGLATLLQAPWPHLVSLDVAHVGAGKHGTQDLLLAILPALKRLDASGLPMQPADLAQFGPRFGPRLVALACRDAALAGAGVEQLLQAAWPSLMGLDLDQNPLGRRGLAALREARGKGRLPQLVRLVVPEVGPSPLLPKGLGRWFWQVCGPSPYARQREALRRTLLATQAPAAAALGARPRLQRQSSSQRTVTLNPVVEQIPS